MVTENGQDVEGLELEAKGLRGVDWLEHAQEGHDNGDCGGPDECPLCILEAADRPNLHAIFENDNVEEYGSIFDDPSWG